MLTLTTIQKQTKHIHTETSKLFYICSHNYVDAMNFINQIFSFLFSFTICCVWRRVERSNDDEENEDRKNEETLRGKKN